MTGLINKGAEMVLCIGLKIFNLKNDTEKIDQMQLTFGYSLSITLQQTSKAYFSGKLNLAQLVMHFLSLPWAQTL